MSFTIEDQLRELEAGANTRRTRKPLYHVHCNPKLDDEELVELFWSLFEQEFGLTRARFASKKHSKGNRGDHTHRVYDITRADGSVVDMSNDFYRREKVMVIACFMLRRSMPPVPHLRAIIKALKAEGRQDVARWVEAQPPAPRAVARRTPAERQAEQRTGSDKGLVADAVMNAWAASDSGQAFQTALRAVGLDLGRGDNAVMIVDGQGGAWSVTRMVGEASRERGERIKAVIVHARVHDLRLPTIENARDAIRARARAAETARREAAQRRATVARVPRDLEARAAELRAILAAIKAKVAEEPPEVTEVRAKATKTCAAKEAAEGLEKRAETVVDDLRSQLAVPRGWWRRLSQWCTGETARLNAAVREAEKYLASARQATSATVAAANRAEVKRDIAVRAWTASAQANVVARVGPLQDQLSYAVRALELLRRDPEAALLPPAEFRRAVEDDPGEDGPAPRPRWG